ncbi:hypothetical protein [Companilactobacillus insicii]|uniref:hypothetical protein n=1 Tax=Companilactobacillus insicii TaxID=1732567 RepID=UPI001B874354|nr:hypothetical protein [Companilactobacillus insicii]
MMLSIFITIGEMINKNIQVIEAAQSVNMDVKPKEEPSEDVKKFLGIWLNRGYSLQPAATTYTVVGHNLHLVTNSGRSTLGMAVSPFASPKYQWYKSTDKGKNWTEVPKNDGGNKEDLYISTKKAGEVHLQQSVNWHNFGGLGYSIAEIWSQVATVYIKDKDKNAEKIEVSVNDNYLYNNPSEIAINSTVATAKVTPEDYTEDIVWSVDDGQLAYIDKETGILRANSRGMSGVVKVIATIINADGSVVSGSTDVTIGGGLEDKMVKSGESTQFEMQGHIGQWYSKDNDYSVRWYRQPAGTHKRELVEGGKRELSYKVHEPRMKNDNDLYWMEINTRFGRETYEYITNKAKLNVLPADKPDITLNNSVMNETFNNNNTDDILNDIANGDIVSYHDEIKLDSEGGDLRNGTYTLPIYGDTEVDSVVVNGEAIDESQYEVINYFGGQSTVLSITNLNCLAGDKIDLKVRTRVDGVYMNDTMIVQPYVYSNEEDNSYRYRGNRKTMNYVTNVLQKSVRDISYGSVMAYTRDELISRTDDTNQPNDIISVDDQRRIKKPIKVFVNQEKEFKNSNGVPLSGCLRFYENSKYSEVMGNKVKVTESKENEPLNSIGWDKNNGLLLHIHDAGLTPGTYSTTLNWSFENSI